MKKIAILSFALLSAIIFVSCNKSGVYNPKDHLSKVWYEKETVTTIDSVNHTSSIPKYLYEEWMWDGKYLASRTVYRSNNEVRFNYVYEYNKKNKIIGITSTIAAEKKTRIRFIYDDDSKMLREIKYFTEDFPDSELPYRWLVFTYDGSKLMSIKETINTHRFPRNSYEETSLLPYLVSQEMANSIEANEIMQKAEYDIKINEYAFEWEKKNISHIKITTTIGENTSEANLSYTYDKNKNLQYGRVMGFIEDNGVNSLICSHNNVVSCTYEDSNRTYTEECEYSYDKKVPVEKTVRRTEMMGNTISKVTEKWTYEYAE